jgi:two-component system, OmpR family, sensor kinase
MKVHRSIRWRLQLWYGLLLLLMLTGFGFTAVHLERTRQIQRIDAELRQQLPHAEHLTRRAGPDGRRPSRSEQSPDEIFNATTGYYYIIWQHNGPDLAPSSNAPPNIPRPADAEFGIRQRGEFREAFSQPRPNDFILVGRSIAADVAAIAQFAWVLFGVGAGVMLAGLLGGWWLATRAIRPIEEISATAVKIAEGDLSRRINVADTDGELGQLAAVLNSTFARLDAAFAQQVRFTGDAAHELRTPVTVMLTHAQNGLQAEGITPEHREAFEACQRAAQRMRRLIESLLELARLDAGQQPLQRARFNLIATMEDCLDLVEPLAEARQIKIIRDLGRAECCGDADRVGQVFINLLTNAIHYNKEAGEMRTENNSVVVIVQDTGPGIAPEHLPHIFDRFYRADSARTTSEGRTGLGLAISKTIIEAHHGKITVQSRVDEGATFRVELPAN